MSHKLHLTHLGKAKLAAAATDGKGVVISEFAAGQGIDVDFSTRLDKQTLVSKRYQAKVESVSIGTQTNQYVVQCKIPVDEGGFTVREVALIDSDGDLIWVGTLPEVQLPAPESLSAVDYRLNFPIQIDNPDVTLVVDANVVTATRSWVEDNYIPRSALELMFPYGYAYWTHVKQNPKPLFDALFGYETFWRRLEGVHLVAVQDDDAYINQPMQLLGQKGNTDAAINNRPHVYPIYSNYLYERYDPSEIVDSVWQISANKKSVLEGEGITFKITVNNVPDGQQVEYKVDEGILKDTSIVNVDNTEKGIATIKDGIATVTYITQQFDYEEEEQKHVHISLSEPANLTLSIPILDRGHLTKVIEEFEFSITKQSHKWIGKHGIYPFQLSTPFPSQILKAVEFTEDGERSTDYERLTKIHKDLAHEKGFTGFRIWLYIPKEYTQDTHSIEVVNKEGVYNAEWQTREYHGSFDINMSEDERTHNNWIFLYNTVDPTNIPSSLNFSINIKRK